MSGWNHNLHYHPLVLRAMPPGCQHALDAGCGQGALARRLAVNSVAVTGIDLDSGCLAVARSAGHLNPPNLRFVHGDLLAHPFAPASFDFVSAVATLHHLPLDRGLIAFRDLLKPGGTLAILGLYRAATLTDYATAAVALPVSRAIRAFHGEAEVGAPITDVRETLNGIREASRDLLTGAQVRRMFFFRYWLTWTKPA